MIFIDKRGMALDSGSLVQRRITTHWVRLDWAIWAGTSENPGGQIRSTLIFCLGGFLVWGGGGCFCAIDRIRAPVQIITRDKAVLRTREDTFCIQSRLRGKRMVGDGPFRDFCFLHQHICTTGIVRARSLNQNQSTVLSLLLHQPCCLVRSVHSCASPESGTHVNPTRARRHLSMPPLPRQCSRVTQRRNHELTFCLKKRGAGW